MQLRFASSFLGIDAVPLQVPEGDAAACIADWLGAEPAVIQASETELGWPVDFAFAVVGSAHRLGAFYRCLHFVGATIVTFPDRAALHANLHAFVAWAQGARPDFRAEHALALGELFEMEARS